MRRLLFVCLIALLAFPAVAGAAYIRGEGPDAFPRHQSDPQSISAPPPVSRITVNHGDSTLPTVLAAVSLGIALTGTAYVAVRLRSLPRT
jgi:hypothetical protein